MERFDQAEFDALREAGLRGEEMLDRIDDHYQRQRPFIASSEWKRAQYVQDIICTAGFCIIAVGIIGTLLSWAVLSAIGYNRYLHSCERGDAVGCIALVQSNQAHIDIPETLQFKREIDHLKTVYRLKTGQELPGSKESAP